MENMENKRSVERSIERSPLVGVALYSQSFTTAIP